MTKLYANSLYREDLERIAALELPWEGLAGKNLLLSGITGLIGSFLTDVLMTKNREGLELRITGITRDPGKAAERFSRWQGDPRLRLIQGDINSPIRQEAPEKTEYVLHLASHTHPMQYSGDPIGTIATNIIGLQNMLEYAAEHGAERFAFASSNEIYGENRGDAELFDESYCGYIDCNTMRAGYPESKRCGEALCQAYRAQKGLDIVIPRLTRSYGPTMLMSDTKAISQFIRRGIAGEDIVLKSAGTQYYSYTYMADAVGGLLTVLLKGKSGEAYNIADERSDIRLKDLAELIAENAGTQVVYEIPDAAEAAGYSRATKARLDGRKLQALGWQAAYDMKTGIGRTMQVLKEIREE
jgi:nucleoside-diphosphate-sugar epimerase